VLTGPKLNERGGDRGREQQGAADGQERDPAP
jgi:hypothetical protein